MELFGRPVVLARAEQSAYRKFFHRRKIWLLAILRLQIEILKIRVVVPEAKTNGMFLARKMTATG
jgi:hypothetical protein